MFIIAEIGINHNGDLDLAKKLILGAKYAGCNAVKFQKRDVDTVYSASEQAKPRESRWGKTLGAQKRGLELSREDYDEIDRYCKTLDIEWFASCWDIKSLEFMDRYNPPYHKIASPMLTHINLVEEIARRQVPVIISTGMSYGPEVDLAMTLMENNETEVFAIMYCVSMYPCPPEYLELTQGICNLIAEYPLVQVGYSGHEVGLGPTLAAVAMGATVIERHITYDRTMYGSDQAASIEPGGLVRLVNGIEEIEKAMGQGRKRGPWPQEIENLKKMRYWDK